MWSTTMRNKNNWFCITNTETAHLNIKEKKISLNLIKDDSENIQLYIRIFFLFSVGQMRGNSYLFVFLS